MEPHVHNEECREVFDLLSQYLDFELPPDACQEIEAHIAGCAPCVEFADSPRKTVALCKKYQPAEPPLPLPLREEARAQLKQAYDRMLAERKQGS